MWDSGIMSEKPERPDGPYSTGISGMWDLRFHINETPIAMSCPMVCIGQAFVPCGIWAVLFMKHQLPSMAAWSAQYGHEVLYGIWASSSMRHFADHPATQHYSCFIDNKATFPHSPSACAVRTI